ncbi:hypothetical protein [Bradyrhizobium elkanii]
MTALCTWSGLRRKFDLDLLLTDGALRAVAEIRQALLDPVAVGVMGKTRRGASIANWACNCGRILRAILAHQDGRQRGLLRGLGSRQADGVENGMPIVDAASTQHWAKEFSR